MRPILVLTLLTTMLLGCDEGGGPAVRGTIYMAPELQSEVRGSDTLFILARAEAAEGAPPLAVRRVVGARFPYRYEIGPSDAMRPEAPLEGPLRIEAYIRRTGVAGMAAPGDMAGAASETARLGDDRVDFNIDRRLP